MGARKGDQGSLELEGPMNLDQGISSSHGEVVEPRSKY